MSQGNLFLTGNFKLTSLWKTQRKIDQKKVDNLLGDLPIRQRVLLARCPDGEIEIIDGHHRVMAYYIAGAGTLQAGEYILIDVDECRPRFGRVGV